MARSKWVEVTCDHCGGVDYYRPGDVTAQARESGWIVTRDGKDFCDKECLSEYRKGATNDHVHN